MAAYNMSLTFIENQSNPKIEPWGTLQDKETD